MSTIVFKTEGAPWRQGGRTVETFRSGLIKTTDTYKTPIAEIDSSLATFAVGDSIEGVTQAYDGIKIYPEPQWKDDGDGFATISVTGYGRTRAATGFTIEPRLTTGELFELTLENDVLVSDRSVPCTKTDFVCKYVLSELEGFLFNEFESLESRFIAYDSNGAPLSYSTLAQTVTLSESAYFGSFTEVTAVIVYTPTLTIRS
jgi:hypothetical protein